MDSKYVLMHVLPSIPARTFQPHSGLQRRKQGGVHIYLSKKCCWEQRRKKKNNQPLECHAKPREGEKDHDGNPVRVRKTPPRNTNSHFLPLICQTACSPHCSYPAFFLNAGKWAKSGRSYVKAKMVAMLWKFSLLLLHHLFDQID